MFCARTVLHVKYEILGVQRPYFADNRVQGPLVREGIGCRVHPPEKYFAKIFDLHKKVLKNFKSLLKHEYKNQYIS